MKLCVGFGQFFFDNFGLMCSFGLGFVCGVRTYHSGSGNAGPAPGKIHEKDPERAQGYSKYNNIDEFHDLRPYLASKMSSGEQNRVLTHSIERLTWLEELASESNTIQAQ